MRTDVPSSYRVDPWPMVGTSPFVGITGVGV